jgi:hypothetical protein
MTLGLRTQSSLASKARTSPWTSSAFAGKSPSSLSQLKVTTADVCFFFLWIREALTPSEDFIISPHPASKNLYIATCGSFHGWKFFPILGKYVVQMLEQTLDKSLEAKWAWDRDLPPTDNNVMWPKKELQDLARAS